MPAARVPDQLEILPDAPLDLREDAEREERELQVAIERSMMREQLFHAAQVYEGEIYSQRHQSSSTRLDDQTAVSRRLEEAYELRRQQVDSELRRRRENTSREDASSDPDPTAPAMSATMAWQNFVAHRIARDQDSTSEPASQDYSSIIPENSYSSPTHQDTTASSTATHENAMSLSSIMNADENSSSAPENPDSRPTALFPPKCPTSSLDSAPSRRGIDDCIAELLSSKDDKPYLVLDAFGADTEIFLDAPPQEADHDFSTHCAVQLHFTKPMRVRAETLRGLHSQYLRRKLFQASRHPSGRSSRPSATNSSGKTPSSPLPMADSSSTQSSITLALNLTPATEGEEAVAGMLDLFCPEGVRHWYQSEQRWTVAHSLVGGADDFSPAMSITSDFKPQSTSGGKTFKDPSPPLEYTRVRHLCAIQRVLMAAEGQDPMLDSAPKVYSFAMVVRSWGIMGNLASFTDWVVRWLRAEPNSRFVEALPEATLAIADALRCHSLAKDAFAILVGEAALDLVVSGSEGSSGLMVKGRSAHGRLRDDVHEAWQQRIEYARDSFVTRVQQQFNALLEDLSWIRRLPECMVLSSLMPDDLASQQLLDMLYEVLEKFVRGTILHLLCGNFDKMVLSREFESPGGDRLYPRNVTKPVWDQIRYRDRIFTRAFWSLLRAVQLPRLNTKAFLMNSHMTNYSYTIQNPKYSSAVTRLNHEGHELEFAGLLPRVRVEEVAGKVSACKERGLQVLRQKKNAATMKASLEPSAAGKSQKPAYAPLVERVKTEQPLEESGIPSSAFHKQDDDFVGTARSLEAQDTILPLHVKNVLNEISFNQNARSQADRDTRRVLFCTDPDLPESRDQTTKDVKTEDTGLSETSRPQNQQSSSPDRRFKAEWSSDDETSSIGDLLQFDSELKASERRNITSGLGRTSQAASTDRRLGLGRKTEDVWIEMMEEIYMASIFRDIEAHFRSVATDMLAGAPGGELGRSIDVHLTNTLTCLDESETQYLPLWAGGYDDGTSGVFGGDVPFSAHGFATPGPSKRVKITPASKSAAGSGHSSNSSEYELVGDGADSTIGTSTQVHDGYSTTFDRRQVYAASSDGVSIASDDTNSQLWAEVWRKTLDKHSRAQETEGDHLRYRMPRQQHDEQDDSIADDSTETFSVVDAESSQPGRSGAPASDAGVSAVRAQLASTSILPGPHSDAQVAASNDSSSAIENTPSQSDATEDVAMGNDAESICTELYRDDEDEFDDWIATASDASDDAGNAFEDLEDAMDTPAMDEDGEKGKTPRQAQRVNDPSASTHVADLSSFNTSRDKGKQPMRYSPLQSSVDITASTVESSQASESTRVYRYVPAEDEDLMSRP